MKKILLSLSCLIMILIFTTGCTNNDDRFIELSFEELQVKVDNNESFPLYVGSTRCSACAQFQPVLKRVIRNHDFTMYHVNLDNFSESEQKEFISMFDINATPSIIYIINGSETSVLTRLIGNVPEADLIRSLTDNGYID